MKEVYDVTTGLDKSEKYFRVFMKFGTHKLHSEKLNLETAIELLFALRQQNIQLSRGLGAAY